MIQHLQRKHDNAKRLAGQLLAQCAHNFLDHDRLLAIVDLINQAHVHAPVYISQDVAACTLCELLQRLCETTSKAKRAEIDTVGRMHAFRFVCMAL
jgi:hypothetical protein